MKDKVLNFINKNKTLQCGDSVILGVSGGADSICMLYMLKEISIEMKLKLYVVHVNHHIRGIQAQEDADYVKKVCNQLNVDFRQVDADIPLMVKKTGMTEEEAGRQARYKAFFERAKEIRNEQSTNKKDGPNEKDNKADNIKIAVAHNLNDNSETVLFNLFRGTGIKGLAGIPVRRDMIIRPLLCCTRQEIENYLKERNISYCTDITNTETEYSRNKIRLELLPYIKNNINEKAEYNIVNAAENLNEICDYLNIEAKKQYNIYVKDSVLVKEAFELHPAILNQIIRMMIERQAGKLKDITRTHVLLIVSLKDMNVSKTIDLPYNLVAVRLYNGISIKKKNLRECTEKIFHEQCILKDGKIYNGEKVQITLENNDFLGENIKEILYTKWFDYDKIKELTVRTRKPGDFLIVDEKGSKKKLKDYFINEKIPKDRREKIPLLADGNHIVWVIGYRISSYYKVTDSTKHVLRADYIEE